MTDIDLNGYHVADPRTIEKGTDVVLVPLGGSAPIRAKFFSLSSGTLSMGLGGATTGIPFPDDEWDVWVQKEFPLPAHEDVAMLIANAVQRGMAGNPSTFDEIASEILSLMKGDIAPGVERWEPPQDAQVLIEDVQPEMSVPTDAPVE